MDHIDALEISWAQGAVLVDELQQGDLVAPTPCEDWTVRQLLNHVWGESRTMALANRGQATGLDHGDLVGDGTQLVETWQDLGRDNVESWRVGGLAGERTYPYGTFAAEVGVLINLGEVLVHNWDLARATGRSYVLDEELATPVFDLYASMPLDDLRAHGVFGPDLEAADDAPVGHRLLALLGRQVATGPGAAIARGAQAETLQLGAATLSLLLDGSDTGSALSAHRGVLPAGSVGARPHYHTRCSEALYMLDGTLEVLAGEDIVVATKGDLLVVPPGTPHAFAAGAGADADFIALVTPGIDRFEGFRQMAAVLSGVSTNGADSASGADYDSHPADSVVWESRS